MTTKLNRIHANLVNSNQMTKAINKIMLKNERDMILNQIQFEHELAKPYSDTKYRGIAHWIAKSPKQSHTPIWLADQLQPSFDQDLATISWEKDHYIITNEDNEEVGTINLNGKYQIETDDENIIDDIQNAQKTIQHEKIKIN